MKKKSDKTFQDLRVRLSSRLARIRLERRLTFEMVADRAGLHWRHVQKIEAGEVNVTLMTLARLATGLSIDVEELVSRAGAR